MPTFYSTRTITRPADTTAYQAGDLVANSTTAGSVTPFAFTVPRWAKVWRARIRKDNATNTNAKFRLHLYYSSPTPANGDNGAWSTTQSGYLGFIDLDMTTDAFTDDSAGVGDHVSEPLLLLGTPAYVASPILVSNTNVIYGLLEALAAYTPTSAETISVSIEGEKA